MTRRRFQPHPRLWRPRKRGIDARVALIPSLFVQIYLMHPLLNRLLRGRNHPWINTICHRGRIPPRRLSISHRPTLKLMPWRSKRLNFYDR